MAQIRGDSSVAGQAAVQQGSIVDQWFAGSTDPDPRSVQQRAFLAMDDDDQHAGHNPYYRYIRDNIRAGVA